MVRRRLVLLLARHCRRVLESAHVYWLHQLPRTLALPLTVRPFPYLHNLVLLLLPSQSNILNPATPRPSSHLRLSRRQQVHLLRPSALLGAVPTAAALTALTRRI